MPRPFPSRAASLRLCAGALAAAGFAVLAGCDLNENADLERGRALFQQQCGTCHALAEAGTSATVGPDLDASFLDARQSGMDDDTIEGVVEAQIDNPREIDEGIAEYNQVFMPPDLVTGQDATDVAAYVADVAGVPGAKPPELPPDQLFVERCGSCHALAAADTSGTTGPDLDETLPGQSDKEVEESIVDPNATIAQGYAADIMPDFGSSLTPEQIAGLVQYLLDNAGK